MNTTTFSWDPQGVLGVFNPKNLSVSCMASTKANPEIRCTQPLSQEKIEAIQEALRDLLATKPADKQIDNAALQSIADHAFCRFHNSDARKDSAIVQWDDALKRARAAHAGIHRLALVGISNDGSSNKNNDGDDDEASPVGGSDTDPPSGPDNDSSDNDGGASDAESTTVSAAGSDAVRAPDDDDAADMEVEGLRQLLERYRLENRTLRSRLRRRHE